jgi:hypothetical protein
MVTSDHTAARDQASAVTLASQGLFISGGNDGAGNPLSTAALVNPSGQIKLTAIAAPMLAPRLGHAVAAAHFPDGDGALLFGGLSLGSNAPVAERMLNQAFSAYAVGAVENRVNATATTMPSGDILILGGKSASAAALASGLVITPGMSARPLSAALSVARAGHTATLTATATPELLVCGGTDAAGVAQASCDVLDVASYMIKRTLPLEIARTGHAATALETGPVVIAGGRDATGAPLASIEIYTP